MPSVSSNRVRAVCLGGSVVVAYLALAVPLETLDAALSATLLGVAAYASTVVD